MQKRWVKFGLALLGVTLVLAGCQSKPADKETLVKKPYEKVITISERFVHCESIIKTRKPC